MADSRTLEQTRDMSNNCVQAKLPADMGKDFRLSAKRQQAHLLRGDTPCVRRRQRYRAAISNRAHIDGDRTALRLAQSGGPRLVADAPILATGAGASSR